MSKFVYRRRKGFTLVEVIVILIIIAILASLLLPSLTGYIDKANQKAAIAECRTAVEAAQTLASESYAERTSFTESDVKELSEVSGTITDLEVSDKGVLLHLTYSNAYTVTYCLKFKTCTRHSQLYTVTEGEAPLGWVKDTAYNVGDEVVIDGVHYTCTAAHTSGTTSATKSPANGNKTRWRISGFDEGADNSYSSQYRYNAGVVVKYSGKLYQRTNYNLNGGATPAGNLTYWTPL